MWDLHRVASLVVLLASLSACATPGGGSAAVRPRGDERATAKGAPAGAPDLGGEPEMETMQRWARSRMGPVRSCYEAGLKKAPTMAGRVVLRFTIRPDGLLEEVEIVEDQLAGSNVADCVRWQVSAWRTPFRPKEAVTVEYPFVFAPLH